MVAAAIVHCPVATQDGGAVGEGEVPLVGPVVVDCFVDEVGSGDPVGAEGGRSGIDVVLATVCVIVETEVTKIVLFKPTVSVYVESDETVAVALKLTVVVCVCRDTCVSVVFCSAVVVNV